MSETPKVYAAIAAIAGKMAREGIAKSRQNREQGYSFRGIDDVYKALAPLLAEHRLCVLPRVLTRELHERKTAKGNPLFNVVCDVEFDFVSAEDGSKHTVRMQGEAMDTADKATNKAMSAAYKYACLQAFCIPTEGDDHDADETTHELAGDPLTEEEIAEWLGALDKAKDAADLARRTSKALAAADALGDRNARERFRAHNLKVSKMLEQAATV